MCLLVVGIRAHRNFPVYLAANREEEAKRKTTLPKIVEDGRILVAGIDEREGGTWLGANQSNFVAAVTNRDEKGGPGKKKSRGHLMLEVLRQDSFEKIQSVIRKTAKQHKPFNLFYGNLSVSYLTSWNGKKLNTERLETGVHVIGRGNLDDRKNPKVKRAFELIEKKTETAMPPDVLPTDWRDLFFQLIQICKDHEPGKDLKETLCRHDKPVRTVSSSLFALGNRGVNYSFFWHLTGNPCEGTYRDYSPLVKKVIVPQKPAAVETSAS